MCVTCGCSPTDAHAHGHDHGHAHNHAHPHPHEHTRVIQVERDLLEANDRIAAQNRTLFRSRGILALNLVSSPGSGKTSLLVATLQALRGRMPLAVVEGDQATDNDAARIRETGVAALQVNTGKGCHLDARMVARAFETLPLPVDGVLFIENVGNLVCPASFDLGEAHKVVLASVTEGEDKPLKYPNMFAASDLMLVSKTDLLPHLRFDVDALIANARRVNPHIEVLQVSAQTGAGFAQWLEWLDRERRAAAGSVIASAGGGDLAAARAATAPAVRQSPATTRP
jgi:hydrogenase nickel incorporation protein HypB